MRFARLRSFVVSILICLVSTFIGLACGMSVVLLAQTVTEPSGITSSGSMSSSAILTISMAVVGLTQLAKWAFNPPDKWGGFVVFAVSLIGVAFWGYSHADFNRSTSWDYFSGWITISMTAAGVFGFTRSTREVVASLKNPGAQP